MLGIQHLSFLDLIILTLGIATNLYPKRTVLWVEDKIIRGKVLRYALRDVLKGSKMKINQV